MIHQGLKFRSAGDFWDWYIGNKINMGLVVDEFCLGDGKILKANFAEKTITDQELTREEFERLCDEQTLGALGLMATMYLIGYTQAVAEILKQAAEEEETPHLIIPATNGRFIN